MAKIEAVFFWLSVFPYACAFFLILLSLVLNRPKLTSAGIVSLWVGLAFHSATVGVRWISAGHAPVTDTYELNLIGTWFTIAIFAGFERWRSLPPAVGLTLIPVAFLVMGHGYVVWSAATPLGAAYQSPWLAVHVLFAWFAFGSYACATGAAVLLLLREHFRDWGALRRIPESAALDLANYRFVVLGFVNHAVMNVSGAVWAKNLWGQYWGWDPLETWSLIAFLTYAFCLHARTFLKWKMQVSAWLTVAALGVLAISFWGVGLFGPTVHPGP